MAPPSSAMSTCFAFVTRKSSGDRRRSPRNRAARRRSRTIGFGRLCARGGPPNPAEEDKDSGPEEVKASQSFISSEQSGFSQPETSSKVLEVLQTACCISDEDQPWSKLVEAHIPGLLAHAVIRELLHSEWTSQTLVVEHTIGCGASEMEVGACVETSDGNATVHTRELNFIMPVPPAPLCPKCTAVTTQCRIVVAAGHQPSALSIQTSTVAHDVPFGGCFVVQVRDELSWEEDDDTCVATKSVRLIFLKSVGWFKGAIQSNVMSEQAKAGESFLTILKTRADNASTNSPSLHRACTTQKGMVWEVQRRSTLFHSDWRAPFMPFDGAHRWRWLDASHSRHHWISTHAKRTDVAKANFPPLTPEGWQMSGRWEVSLAGRDQGTMDDDGWQYCVSLFTKGEKGWFKSNTGKMCRRRLWTCHFQEAPEVSRKGGRTRTM
mmetsp:Transcript_74510/g.241052  ORF Transcript_74510/g.241052 Transcript_74510/m.241052 type:complete len:436 (-) Transcript_74510:33-1340(-)